MRVLLDESVPRPLTRFLIGHHVETVPSRGWSGVKNGDLLRRASAEFDVLVTGDQNLEYQQNLLSLSIAIVIVVAPDNRVETYAGLASGILQAIEATRPGVVVHVVA